MMDLASLDTPERRAQGRVIVLPGIEGYSRWNRSIVRGLVQAGLPFAFEIHDWTFGRWRSLWSLRSARRHQEQSCLIADKVAAAKAEAPSAPVWLVGHSGGGAMSILSLERLPAEVQAEGAILLAPALSPAYDLALALRQTQRGVWNFSSWADWFFLVFGTSMMGTLDGVHSVSAGASGFRPQKCPSDLPPVHEVPWRREMFACRNLAGHFGCVHAAFVGRWIAPILAGGDIPMSTTSPQSEAPPATAQHR